jgi:hypothetical protein
MGQTPAQGFWLAELRPKVALHIPISVDGIPDGTEIQVNAFLISFQSPDGRSKQLDWMDCRDIKRATLAPGTAALSLVCSADPEFFSRERNQPLMMRASLYLTLFGNTRSQTIPLGEQPVTASDGLQCYMDSVPTEWMVYCRSALRWPERLVYAKLANTDGNLFPQPLSDSPFPADLNIEPVETRLLTSAGRVGASLVHDVNIVTEEPLAHLRRDIAIRDVRLIEPGPVQ